MKGGRQSIGVSILIKFLVIAQSSQCHMPESYSDIHNPIFRDEYPKQVTDHLRSLQLDLWHSQQFYV